MRAPMNAPAAPPDTAAAPSLWRGAALNLASRVATVGLGLAILVLVARQGPQVQGAFSLFVAIESALLALGSGLGLLLAREASQAHGALAPRRLRQGLAWALLAGLVAAAVLAGASRLASADPYRALWLLAIAAPFLLLAPTASGVWMGQGRLLALNAAQVAAPLLVLMLMASMALGAAGAGLLGVLVAWALGKAVVGVGAAAWAWARPAAAVGPALPPTDVGAAWRFVAVIALANIVSLANYRVTLFLLERFHGLSAVGVYSVSVQVAELLWLLSSAVTVSAYRGIGTPEPAQAIATTLRAVRLGVGAALAAAPVLGIGAWLALPAVVGEAYRGALWPLAVLLPGVVAYAAASALSAYYTHHRGRPHWAAGIAALSLLLTLALGLWAVPRWGAVGAAMATSIAYLLAIAVAGTLFARDAGRAGPGGRRGDNPRPDRTD